MNAKQIQDTVDRVMELVNEFSEGMDEMFEGIPLDHRRLTDEEYVVWFQSMVKRDPNWVLALPFVEGGRKELQRYARASGLKELMGAFAPSPAERQANLDTWRR